MNVAEMTREASAHQPPVGSVLAQGWVGSHLLRVCNFLLSPPSSAQNEADFPEFLVP